MASWRSRYHLSCLRETELYKISIIGQTPDVIQNTLDALFDLWLSSNCPKMNEEELPNLLYLEQTFHIGLACQFWALSYSV